MSSRNEVGDEEEKDIESVNKTTGTKTVLFNVKVRILRATIRISVILENSCSLVPDRESNWGQIKLKKQ